MKDNKTPVLNDYCLESGVYGIPAAAEKFDADEYRYLRITDISDDGVLLDRDAKSISDKDANKYLLSENDIVFARTGNSTGRTYFYDKRDGELVFAGFLIKYKLDEKKINPKYLKYFTISKQYKHWVDNFSTGSTRGNMSAQDFGGMPLIVPKREQQDLLVRILDAITDKISLNNRINTELEQMAKTIFNYWFVQYDFPDNEGRPYKTSGGEMEFNEELKREIPKGWKAKPLNKVTDVSNDSVNPQEYLDNDFKHFSIPTLDTTGTYGVEKGSEINSSKFTVLESDVLVSKLNPWFSRVVYGEEAPNIICSTEFVVWRSRNNNIKNFLFMIATDKSFISYCTKNATGTSNSHKRVNPTLMMEYLISYNDNIVEIFGEKINGILKLIFSNKKEIKELITLRDFLLPLLMNGQVKVK